MTPVAVLESTILETLHLIDQNIPGDLVEFGTWKGGNCFAMLLAQQMAYGKIVRPVWMFDSFEGLPDADERDGPAAIQYQKDVTSPHYLDNCTASLSQVLTTIDAFGFSPEEAIVVPGWFNVTLPQCKPVLESRRIALLRIDCDWYEPVKLVLDEATPLVSENGVIVLDDYFAWDGCARATHDYLSQSQLPFRIRSEPPYDVAWMRKESSGRKPIVF